MDTVCYDNASFQERIGCWKIYGAGYLLRHWQPLWADISKKRLDENKGREAVAAAVESGEILEGFVTEANSGGVVVLVNNVRVFVPRSQATLRHGED